jgi:hypothetical protein
MRKEHPMIFRKACQKAIFFFHDELKCLDFRPDLFALELLFLELQLIATDEDKHPEHLIAQLKKIIQNLQHAPKAKQIKNSFKQYLHQDWELDFILNYLFPDLTAEKLLRKTA